MDGVNYELTGKIFGDFASIEMNSDNSIKLLDLFKDMGLIPSIFHEIGNINLPRMRLSTPDNFVSVLIARNELVIIRNTDSIQDSSIESIDDFIDIASEISSRIMNAYNKKGSRVALITKSLFHEMEDQLLDKFYGNVVEPISFYQQNKPSEWKIHNVAKLDYQILNSLEKSNIGTSILRMSGVMNLQSSIESFDRIGVDFDINTVSENTETRFDGISVREFWQTAAKTRITILSDIYSVINNG